MSWKKVVLERIENLYGGIDSTPEQGIELWNEAITEVIKVVNELAYTDPENHSRRS